MMSGRSELHEFLIKPVRDLRLKAIVYGVRYPEIALQTLAEAGIGYGGWLPNFRVPEVFARGPGHRSHPAQTLHERFRWNTDDSAL